MSAGAARALPRCGRCGRLIYGDLCICHDEAIEPTTRRGRLNVYTCDGADGCGRRLVTVDRDEGTTPVFVRCTTEGCRGMMSSAWYPPEVEGEPTHEWYRPSRRAAKRMGPSTRDHVQRGGLILRRIDR